LYVYSTNTDFEPTEGQNKHGYSKFEADAVLNHNGDMRKGNGASQSRQETDAEADNFEQDDEPTTWEPVNLEPCLNGEKTQPQPCLGMRRDKDGVQLIYPGREHAVLGDTEAGKSWFALGCVVAELNQGRTVVYIHYEEPDETSTIERLLLIGVDKDV